MIATIATKAITPTAMAIHRRHVLSAAPARQGQAMPGARAAGSGAASATIGSRAAGTTCARHRHRTCALGRHPTPIALGRPHMPSIRPGGTAPQRRLAPGLSAPMDTSRPQRSTKTHGVFSLETQRPQSLIAIAGRAVPSRVQRPCNATGLGAYIKMCSASLPPPKIT